MYIYHLYNKKHTVSRVLDEQLASANLLSTSARAI